MTKACEGNKSDKSAGPPPVMAVSPAYLVNVANGVNDESSFEGEKRNKT